MTVQLYLHFYAVEHRQDPTKFAIGPGFAAQGLRRHQAGGTAQEQRWRSPAHGWASRKATCRHSRRNVRLCQSSSLLQNHEISHGPDAPHLTTMTWRSASQLSSVW